MEVFTIQNNNNNNLSFSKGVPLKDSTTDGASSFEMGRKTYIKMFMGLQTTNQVSNQKKWFGGSNNDASVITERKRYREIGKGSVNLDVNNKHQTISFCNNADVNLINRRKMFTRSGGCVVPPKCRYTNM